MMRTLFIFLLTVLSTLNKPSCAATSLANIEDYLNGIKTLQGSFQQMSPGGELQRGRFAIQKPGKMRLDYAAPSTQIIFAHDGTLYFYDRNTSDLSQTPLDQSLAELLLQNDISLNDSVRIKAFEEDDTTVTLTLQKIGGEDLGELTLVFNLKPFQLIQWVIIDAQGQKTLVNLFNIKQNQAVHLKTDPQQIVQPS